jgi:hypothetical protein
MSGSPQDAQEQVAQPRRIPFLAISIALVAIMAGSALFLSGYSMGRQAAAEPGTPRSESEAFQPFWDTYRAIGDRYAGGDVDRTLLVQGAIRGMISALGDPYSAYLTSDEYRESLLGIGGQFEGIGAEIAAQGPDGTEGCSPLGTACHLVVTKPLFAVVAPIKAGVMKGDIVVSVDGTALDGLTVDAARDKIRGPKGSVVKLAVCAGAALLQLTITRDIVQTKEVDSQALAGGTVGHRVVGLLGCRGGPGRRGAHGASHGRPDEAHPRPAWQSGRLRHRRAQDRQPVHRVWAGLLGAGREGGSGRHRHTRRWRRDRRRPPGHRPD